MAEGRRSRSRFRSGGTNVPVASVPSSATSMPRFWPLISKQQMLCPLVPCTLYTGKVRRRACGQHKSESTNARMRGRSCPEALASLEPECVCPKVGAHPHKSQSFSSEEEVWKRGRNAQNPLCCSQRSFLERWNGCGRRSCSGTCV